MRLSLIALVPLFYVVYAHSNARIDELATRAFDDSLLTTRQYLADISTRDLLNGLADRLQRRESRSDRFKRWIKMKWPSGRFYCLECGAPGTWFHTENGAMKHIKEKGDNHDLWIKNGKNGDPSCLVLEKGKLQSVHCPT
ncbi:hypothetical protein DFP72DRAFT_1162309 [Ephemerocybe angulata]|uniref:Uncharacterized protein n=1 Tax=Ephemerocybe angulata TaxID=980116 RepID=A0A8H6IHU6_9AGAR|nr:hypothetical protein DFP72DRAFT_1163497 [Tulosesus angulatus]KAF6765320.1 hypothetical protein DFP72DRAFT_1162309 [Tulosesus angulatus]